MKMRKRLTALALAAMMLAAMALGAGAADAGERSVFLPEGIELTAPDTAAVAADGYVLYENEHVKFSMEVPAAYTVTEPYENTVLVTDEDPQDFQVHAEYTFATVDSAHFLYDAQDFADLIEADKKQLTDWVGTQELEVLGTGWGEVAGKRCFVCAFTMNGGDATGGLYIFDGQGDFGCYCVTAFINERSDKAALYGEQLQHMVETFAVTGPYQMEGYTLYDMEAEDARVRFFLRGEAKVNDGDSAAIYPVSSVYSEANIYVSRGYETADHTLDRMIELNTGYFFSYCDNARFTTQPSHFDLGRYSYDMVELEYDQDETHLTTRSAVFISGGFWWEVEAEYTAEYADTVNDTFSDILFSLRVDNDGAVPGTVSSAPEAPAQTQDSQPAADNNAGSAGVSAVLDVIQAQEGFSPSDKEPIGFVYGLPGGSELLVTEYEIAETGGGYSVCSDAWLVGAGSAVLLGRNQVYKEAGGGMGWVTVAEKDGVTYVGLQSYMSYETGSDEYRVYLPVDEQEGAFGEGVYMEIHNVLDGNGFVFGSAMVDGASCAEEDFYAAVRGFDDVDDGLPMDLRWGPDDGVMSFDGLREAYPGGAAPVEAAPDTAGSAAGPALTQVAGPITTPNVVEQIVNSIKSQPGFGSSTSSYQPLGCGWYLPGAGRLILTEYEISDRSNGFDDWYVCTDAWLVKDGGAVLLGRNQLYREVGGNSGSVSIVQKDGVVYVEMECHLWEGDQFNNYYVYLPVDEQAGAFGQGVYMEAHGTVGGEDSGDYIIDGEYWPKSDFDIARGEYEQMLTVDIIQGPEDFGAQPLDDMPQSFPDEDIFAVRTDVW